MKTILAIFSVSFGLALVLTPIIGHIARNFEWVDRPTRRKVHREFIPRIGGVAIYLAFFGPLLCNFIYQDNLISEIISNQSLIRIYIGATAIFLLGLVDDIFRVSALSKLIIQTAIAVFTFASGISITHFQLPWTSVFVLGWLSLPVTVFWYLLVINAVNLIDGLDGLAAGVVFFASMVLLVLSIFGEKFLVAAGLAAIGGACLGFLRYNFNPASIFMGDSGSYFLGYIIASLSIMGSMRSQTTVAILIPVIALGVPIFDVICAPIRRFITGQNLFSPDKDHLHHRLLKMGFTHRNVVLILYIITILLGMVALILVYLQTDFIGILLGLLALGVILGVRKIGYLEYITVDKFFGWFSDISDELGLCRHRRTFLGLQMNLYESKTITEFRENLIKACMFLKLDYLKISLEHHDAGDGEGSLPLIWKSDNYNSIADALSSPQNFYITLPLRCPQANQGYIALARLKNCEDLEPYILRRIEHLRRSVESTLMSILQESASEQEATAEIFSGGIGAPLKPKSISFHGKS